MRIRRRSPREKMGVRGRSPRKTNWLRGRRLRENKWKSGSGAPSEKMGDRERPTPWRKKIMVCKPPETADKVVFGPGPRSGAWRRAAATRISW